LRRGAGGDAGHDDGQRDDNSKLSHFISFGCAGGAGGWFEVKFGGGGTFASPAAINPAPVTMASKVVVQSASVIVCDLMEKIRCTRPPTIMVMPADVVFQ